LRERTETVGGGMGVIGTGETKEKRTEENQPHKKEVRLSGVPSFSTKGEGTTKNEKTRETPGSRKGLLTKVTKGGRN